MNSMFPRKETLGVDGSNVFRFGRDYYFSRNIALINGVEWPLDNYWYLKKRVRTYKDFDRKISNWGFAYCRFYDCGIYSVFDCIEQEDGIPYYITEIKTRDNEIIEKKIYAGEAVNGKEIENTASEIYEIYSALFPKYIGWIDQKLFNFEKTDEKMKKIDSEIYKNRILNLREKKNKLRENIEREITRYENQQEKFESLKKFLNEYECKTDDGKNVIDEVLKSVESVKEIDLENDVTSVLNRGSQIDEVDVNNLECAELKEEFEKNEKEKEDLEDVLENIRDVNCFNGRLIYEIEEKIKNIVNKDKVNENCDDEKGEEEKSDDSRLDDFCY